MGRDMEKVDGRGEGEERQKYPSASELLFPLKIPLEMSTVTSPLWKLSDLTD